MELRDKLLKQQEDMARKNYLQQRSLSRHVVFDVIRDHAKKVDWQIVDRKYKNILKEPEMERYQSVEIKRNENYRAD